MNDDDKKNATMFKIFLSLIPASWKGLVEIVGNLVKQIRNGNNKERNFSKYNKLNSKMISCG